MIFQKKKNKNNTANNKIDKLEAENSSLKSKLEQLQLKYEKLLNNSRLKFKNIENHIGTITDDKQKEFEKIQKSELDEKLQNSKIVLTKHKLILDKWFQSDELIEKIEEYVEHKDAQEDLEGTTATSDINDKFFISHKMYGEEIFNNELDFAVYKDQQIHRLREMKNKSVVKELWDKDCIVSHDLQELNEKIKDIESLNSVETYINIVKERQEYEKKCQEYFRMCNEKIELENEYFEKIWQEDETKKLYQSYIQRFQELEVLCNSLICNYSKYEFQSNDKLIYLEKILNKKWKNFESIWDEWNGQDAFYWFKYCINKKSNIFSTQYISKYDTTDVRNDVMKILFGITEYQIFNNVCTSFDQLDAVNHAALKNYEINNIEIQDLLMENIKRVIDTYPKPKLSMINEESKHIDEVNINEYASNNEKENVNPDYLCSYSKKINE